MPRDMLESLNRAVVETALDAIVMIDHTGAIIEFNPAAESIFGRKRDEVLGESMQQLLVPEHLRDGHARGMARYLQDRESTILGRRLRLVGLRSDGVEFPVELTVNQISDLEPPLFIGSLRDISEEVSSEERLKQVLAEAERANSAKDDFIALITHEIRTSMNGLLGMLQMLEEGTGERERGEFTLTARNSAEALLTIIDDILDFAQLNAGTAEPKLDAFELSKLVRSVVTILEPAAWKKDLSLTFTLPPELPEAVLGDQARIRQILMNLVGNAVKFTDHGNVWINVIRDPGTDSVWHFEVHDTGVGIELDNAEQVFEPFVQGTQSKRQQSGGTGLGLTISRTMAELLGGGIELTHRPEGGTTFRVTLPLEETVRPVVDAGGAKSAAGFERLHGLRVLVADDSKSNRHVAHAMLDAVGCRVSLVEDGLAAVEAVGDGTPFDVVLMDLNMPRLDGVDATAQLRDKGVAIPILAVTARPASDLASMRGFNGKVGKPILRARLYKALTRVLDAEPTAADQGAEAAEPDQHDPFVVDQAILQRLRDEVGAIPFPAIAQECLEELNSRIADLAKVDVANGKEVQFIVHDLDTSSGTLGAVRLNAVVRDLQNATSSDETLELDELRRLVIEEHRIALPVLEAVSNRLIGSPLDEEA